MKKQDGFGHEKPNEGETNDWITPKWVIDAFDRYAYENLHRGCMFDLDPCASLTQPWNCARKAYTIEQDGLAHAWDGVVWCNPPYGANVAVWMRLMAQHRNGIALVFARVETRAWQQDIFRQCSGVVFPDRRIQFCRPDGTMPASSAGAPSAFVAYGDECRNVLIDMVRSGAIGGTFLDVIEYTR